MDRSLAARRPDHDGQRSPCQPCRRCGRRIASSRPWCRVVGPCRFETGAHSGLHAQPDREECE